MKSLNHTNTQEKGYAMTSLYTENSVIGRLLTIFSSLFPAATRPTRHLLAWLLIAQLALESASSVRCLFRQFLSKQTDASLNSYYRALGNGLVTDASIRQALTLRVLAIVPEALRQEPILLSVDDTRPLLSGASISTAWAFCTTTPSTMASPISMAMPLSA